MVCGLFSKSLHRFPCLSLLYPPPPPSKLGNNVVTPNASPARTSTAVTAPMATLARGERVLAHRLGVHSTRQGGSQNRLPRSAVLDGSHAGCAQQWQLAGRCGAPEGGRRPKAPRLVAPPTLTLRTIRRSRAPRGCGCWKALSAESHSAMSAFTSEAMSAGVASASRFNRILPCLSTIQNGMSWDTS